MPTPYGSRGGMAFSADELRVLRRALDIALRPHSSTGCPGPARDAEVRDCLRLAEAVAEAGREGDRLHAFLVADLDRHRSALPGAATGYLRRLQDALAGGHRPERADLAALRSLCALPAGPRETARRQALLARCTELAGEQEPARQPRPAPPAKPAPTPPPAAPSPKPPRPDRPIPTPGEVFPPRRKPVPPAGSRLAGARR
ncbi:MULTISPECIES: hypothetical protein [Streptomyces]